MTAIFEIWTEFWKLHVSFEHYQRDFRVPVKIPPVYWWYKAMNFSLYYRIKYFKKNSCFLSILNPFFFFFSSLSFSERFSEKQHSIHMLALQRGIRMFISFSEILVMRDVIYCEYHCPPSWNRVLKGLWDLKYWSVIGKKPFKCPTLACSIVQGLSSMTHFLLQSMAFLILEDALSAWMNFGQTFVVRLVMDL